MSIELRVKYLLLEDIFPTKGNPRTHSKEQIKLLADSMRAFDVLAPLVIDENNVLVAGNARLSAAKLLGLKAVPTICVTHLSEPEKRAFILGDNRIAELADWDQDLLRIELEFLSSLEIDFNILSTSSAMHASYFYYCFFHIFNF